MDNYSERTAGQLEGLTQEEIKESSPGSRKTAEHPTFVYYSQKLTLIKFTFSRFLCWEPATESACSWWKIKSRSALLIGRPRWWCGPNWIQYLDLCFSCFPLLSLNDRSILILSINGCSDCNKSASQQQWLWLLCYFTTTSAAWCPEILLQGLLLLSVAFETMEKNWFNWNFRRIPIDPRWMEWGQGRRSVLERELQCTSSRACPSRGHFVGGR